MGGISRAKNIRDSRSNCNPYTERIKTDFTRDFNRYDPVLRDLGRNLPRSETK